MRVNLGVFMIVAGTIAGCASTPPAPPPMVAMEAPPPPAPAPVMATPVDGTYRGPVMSTADSRPRCRKMPAVASTRVRNNVFTLGGMRGRVGPDGAVTMAARRGTTVSGMLANGSLNVTTMSGGCGYRYTLARG